MNHTEQIVAVTGASGFIGSALVAAMKSNSMSFRASNSRLYTPGAYFMCLKSRSISTELLAGASVLCHVAGIAETRGVSEQEYRNVTVDGARWLFEEAVNAGVKRIVLVSSSKAGFEFGEQVSEATPDRPVSDYGKTKFEQERILKEIAGAASIEYVIFRPALVFGKNVKGTLRAWIRRSRIPIPPFPVGGARSLVSVNDLASALLLGCRDPRAANQIFYVSDGVSYQVNEMDAAIRASVHAPLRINGFSWLWRVLAATGSAAKMVKLDIGMDKDRLAAMTGVSTCSSQHLRSTLNWRPSEDFYSVLPSIVHSLCE